MLTPQEVSAHAFTKAVMGGYNMAMVDEFLDELTDDYTALYKENAALKAKMKVLVEKVEDYRATEDSIRATLVTAQKMADSIVHEAEQKRDQMLAQAEQDARGKVGELRREFDEAQERLRSGQRELAEFISGTRELCTRQLAFLDQLPQMAVEEPEVPKTEPAVQIEEKILAAFGEEPVEEAPEPAETAAPVVPAEEKPPVQQEDRAMPPVQQEKPAYPEGNPFELPENDEPTRRMDLHDLKFGRNYGLDDDDD